MHGSEIGVAPMAAATVLATGAGVQWIQRSRDAGESFVEPVVRTWTWWQNAGVDLSIGEYIDGLSVMALFLVSFISLLVQIYSLEYVRGDRRYTHFFASITLFSAGRTVTFPLWVFGVSRLGIPPEVNVLGTLIFLVAVIFILVQLWSQRRAVDAQQSTAA